MKGGATGNTARRKVVVGGTYRDYREWLRDNRVNAGDARYIIYPEQLMGLELDENDIVRLGYISQAMEELLRSRIR